MHASSECRRKKIHFDHLELIFENLLLIARNENMYLRAECVIF